MFVESFNVDVYSQIVALLQPRMKYVKDVECFGEWHVRRDKIDSPFFCVLVQGACHLRLDGHDEIKLMRGDFVLVPAATSFSMKSCERKNNDVAVTMPIEKGAGKYSVGDVTQKSDTRILVGHYHLRFNDGYFSQHFLPRRILIQRAKNLSFLLSAIIEEVNLDKPGKDFVVDRLIEIIFLEALRGGKPEKFNPNLIDALNDDKIGAVLKAVHADIQCNWTIEKLAEICSLSRSSFLRKFAQKLGKPPYEYIKDWKMTIAKNLLRDTSTPIYDISEQVGYQSASAFSTAFLKHTGVAPNDYRNSTIGSICGEQTSSQKGDVSI